MFNSLAVQYLIVSGGHVRWRRWVLPVIRMMLAGQHWLRMCSAPERLVMPPGLWKELIGHLQEAQPHEGVGLLAVKATPWFGPMTAVHFYPGTNTLHSANRFAMDGEEVLKAFRDIRKQGWTLGAIVHSHLAGPASPSPTDLREAHYPEALMLIVSFANCTMDARAWRIGGHPEGPGSCQEVPILRWWQRPGGRDLDDRARFRHRDVSQYRTRIQTTVNA